MERERRSWYSEAALDLSDRESLAAGLHKQPENLQARGIAQFGEATGGCVEVHGGNLAHDPTAYNYKTGCIEIIRTHPRRMPIGSRPPCARSSGPWGCARLHS